MSRLIQLLFVALSALALAAPARQASAAGQVVASGYTVLDGSLRHLRQDFNDHSQDVRLVFIVGPTCPVCLRGMDDLGTVLSPERGNSRLRTYVVYVPALGARAADIAPTLPLLPGKYVSRYWDPAGLSGHRFNHTLGITGFAWDVWMVYGSGQLWNGARPPLPEFWMEQLGGLPKWRYLNAKVFARQVARQLARGHPAVATRKTGT